MLLANYQSAEMIGGNSVHFHGCFQGKTLYSLLTQPYPEVLPEINYPSQSFHIYSLNQIPSVLSTYTDFLIRHNSDTMQSLGTYCKQSNE